MTHRLALLAAMIVVAVAFWSLPWWAIAGAVGYVAFTAAVDA